MKMNQYFPTRKSLILGIIIWGAILGTLVMTGYSMSMEINITAIIIVTIVIVPITVIMFAVWFRTGYFVNEQSLTIKIGPYTERDIDVADIISLKRSYSVLASPANSSAFSAAFLAPFLASPNISSILSFKFFSSDIVFVGLID